jgi:hypothetical protein
MGNDSLLAFFEIPKGREPAHNRNAIGAMQHCAFTVTRRDSATSRHGCGIRLEFACQPEDGERPAVIDCIAQTKNEARAELASLPGATPEWVEKRLAALAK